MTKTIGIIGLAGSGKSFAADYLIQKYDFKGICLDDVGHQVLREKAVIDWIGYSFGTNVLQGGQVNRKALGAIVFQDASALNKLNNFVHPILVERAKIQILESKEKVVIQGALLIDFELDAFCDVVLGMRADFEAIANFSGPKQWMITGSQDHLLQQLDAVEIKIHNHFDELRLYQQLDQKLAAYLH